VAPFSDIPDKLTIKKLHDIVSANSICMFTTALDNFPTHARPMNTQYADRNGSLWFFSNKSSVKNEDIRLDSRVQLFYVDPAIGQYVNIYGHAQILFDREKIEEFWSEYALNWFMGKDDPQISLIKVAPENILQWDAEHKKMAIAFELKTKKKTSAENSATQIHVTDIEANTIEPEPKASDAS
jgi:general stress protein 26